MYYKIHYKKKKKKITKLVCSDFYSTSHAGEG